MCLYESDRQSLEVEKIRLRRFDCAPWMMHIEMQGYTVDIEDPALTNSSAIKLGSRHTLLWSKSIVRENRLFAKVHPKNRKGRL
jgi:hypothetical protein